MEKIDAHIVKQRKIPLLFAPERFDDLEDYLPWCELYELDQEAELALQSEVRLVLGGRGLGIALPAQKSYFYVSSIDIQARIRAGRRSELARACLGNKDSMLVLDAFAGFGVDGLTLAGLGADVTLVERNLVVWLILRSIAWGHPKAAIYLADSAELLQSEKVWNVVYLDPMFPPTKKSALPKRDLQILREVSDAAPSSKKYLEQLIEIAKDSATDRVVLKRRKNDPEVAKPNFSICSKTIRFDVFLC